MAVNTMLKEHTKVANRLDYFKKAKENKISDKDLIQKLADDYCDATESGDDALRDKAMAGLLVKFWRGIGKMQKKCSAVSHLEYGDFYAQLYRCIQAACEYKAWRDPAKKTNAQACINQLICSRGAAEILYQSNLDKNKANYCGVSLDADLNEETDDKKTTLGDTIADPDAKAGISKADALIQMYLDENKIVEAIVVDTIAHGDSVKTTSENYSYITYVKNKDTDKYEAITNTSRVNHVEFWRYRCAQLLMNLPDNYESVFATKFRVEESKLVLAVNAIRTAKNTKVYKYLDNTIAMMQSQKSLLISLLS